MEGKAIAHMNPELNLKKKKKESTKISILGKTRKNLGFYTVITFLMKENHQWVRKI